MSFVSRWMHCKSATIMHLPKMCGGQRARERPREWALTFGESVLTLVLWIFLMQQTVYVSQHEFEVRTEHYRLSFVCVFFKFKHNRGSVTNSTDRQTRLVRCLSHFEERFEVHLAWIWSLNIQYILDCAVEHGLTKLTKHKPATGWEISNDISFLEGW